MANYKFGIYEPPHKRWPVAWYNPAVLMRSALETISTGDQIRNLDRRELFTGNFNVIDISAQSSDSDFWWDFMSDSGDGGNASYSIARAMQTHDLQLAEGSFPTQPLPRGKLLVLGGDLSYPGASPEEYQYRFIEMWEASRPLGDETRTVLAIPQNHDWFDNISSFNRHFIGDYAQHFLDAYTPQTRSYFAARLPQNWWLLGLDFALVGDLDRAQLDAFMKLVAQDMKPDDNVILLYPEPYWTRPLGDDARLGYPKRYQRLEEALLQRGIKIRLRLAGDLHHYVRSTATSGADLHYDDMLVTCGSGGAFLHPTHALRVSADKVMDRAEDLGTMTQDLKKRTRVGTQSNAPTEQQRQYKNSAFYPNRIKSWFWAWLNIVILFKPLPIRDLYSLPAQGNWIAKIFQRINETKEWAFSGNVVLPFLLGLLYWFAVYCNSFVFSPAFIDSGFVAASHITTVALPDFWQMWFKAFLFSPLGLIIHLVIFFLCVCTALEDGWRSIIPGAIHGGVHLFAVPTLFWLISFYEPNAYIKGLWLVASGIIAGGLLFGIFFFLMSAAGRMANNAFSPLAHEGYKGFLRFKIDKNGNLHGYMIGTDSVPKRWKINPNGTRPLWVEYSLKAAPVWKLRDVFVLKK
ncbi:MAG: metallophosphoesterase [Gammaproteobacteria bacterium]|nr:MAG: metallophosphoesterase [Gammaproteobacteria bacterium]